MLHTNATNHDTSECKVLQEQARKMRSQWKTHKGNNGDYARKKPKYNNYSQKNANPFAKDGMFYEQMKSCMQELFQTEKTKKQESHQIDDVDLDDFENLSVSDKSHQDSEE